MKDKKGRSRMQCLKAGCDCDEYTKEKGFDLCAYCDHAPVLHKVEDNLNLVEDIELAHFSKSNAILNTLSTALSMSIVLFEPQYYKKENGYASFESATLSRSEIDFSLDNRKVTSPLKKQCIQQAKPFQDTAGKIVFASKTVLHHKNSTLFENGLAPILNSCTDGIIVLSALNLTFSLRSKLARIVVNHIIQKKGLQLKCFQSGTKDIPNFKLLLDLKADASVNIDFTQLNMQKNYEHCSNFMFQKIRLHAKKLIGLVAKKYSMQDVS
ncbi:uncharacterized protein LOC105851014 isoform X3 [Hydra vulgaris]|uniref:uncharacterized protein LOC105851014 isoform X3 n=1 Tax=Hydra vulgaris TaxID=6087 RepID=UPI001F5EAB61|nr:uncharacterized protein LOC105851014 isoform X3 [Hydra vulgaris]